MNMPEYSSTKLSYVLINWARDPKSRKSLALSLKEAYEHIEIDVNLKDDLPKFYHQFFAALYVKDLAKDLISAGFPMIELYKKYNEHLNWTKDEKLSKYVEQEDKNFYTLSMQQKETSLFPLAYLSNNELIEQEVKKETNIYLQAQVFHEIVENIQSYQQKAQGETLNNIKKIREDSNSLNTSQPKLG